MGERPENKSLGRRSAMADSRGVDSLGAGETATLPDSGGGVNPARRAMMSSCGAAIATFLVVQLVEIWSAKPSKNVGDVALIEMETRRVFSASPPLLGAYSRYGWRHPGGLLFWLWAPIYEVLGRSSKSLSTAAAVLVACGLVWLVFAIGRSSTEVAVVGGLAAMAMIATVGENGIASAWNVTATLVPFMLVLVGVGTAATAPEPLAIATWTVAWWLFVFQTHVGTGVVIFPAVFAMVIVLAVRRFRQPWPVRFSRQVWVALAVLIVAALPLIVDVVVRRGGNLRAILGWTRADGPSTAGFGAATTIVGRATSLSFLTSSPPPHITFPVIPEWGLLPGPLVVLFAVACALAVRERQRRWTAILVALGITWLSALVAVARIPVPVYFWLVAWLQPLGWLTWIVTIYIGVRALATRTASARRRRADGGRRPTRPRGLQGRAIPTLAIVGVLIGTIAAVGSGSPTLSTDRTEQQVTALGAALGPEAGSAPILIDSGADDISGAVMSAGLLNDLDRRGTAVCAGQLWGFRVSEPWQCGSQRRPGATVLVRAEAAVLPPPPGTTTLAISDYLSTEQRVAVDAATERVNAFLVGRGRPDLVERVGTMFGSTVLDAPEIGRDDPTIVADVALLDRVARLRGRRYGMYLVSDAANDQPG